MKLQTLISEKFAAPLTGRGPVDAEQPEDLEDVGDHSGQTVGDVHLSVLQRLGVGDKLVHLLGDPDGVQLRDAEQRSEKGQPQVDQRLELLQKHVQSRFRR